MFLEKQKMNFWPKLMTVMQVGYRKRNKFFNISYFGCIFVSLFRQTSVQISILIILRQAFLQTSLMVVST